MFIATPTLAARNPACQSMGSRRYRVALFLVFFQMSGSVFRIGCCGMKAMPDKFMFAVNEHIIHQFPMALVDYLDTSRI
ncbi:hypothetical protein KCP76_22465 [Salmonella enterica subsp. enterica serovar Weltevreden]|nr:hypothetical protein KCP76_22465 [Salmonella enterica subsp. enterica serovar Weltevreden]